MGQIIVLNRLPAGVTPLGEWLAEAADRVALVTSVEAADGYEGTFSTVVGVDDYSHGPGVARVLDQLCEGGDVDRIVHITEEDVLRAATARDTHGVAGQSCADALPYRDKLAMKQHVARAGLRVPAFCAPASAEEAVRFASRYGWPIVVKPRLGYASTGVRVIRSEDELRNEYARRDPGDLLLESFVPGPVYHVDGVSAEGEVVFACPSRYVNDCLAFHASLPLGSAQMDGADRVEAELRAFAASVAQALPHLDRTPFHLEVIVHESTGELFFCEVACRLGGGHMMETLTLRTGVNPARAWVRRQAGLPDPGDGPITLRSTFYGWVLMPPRPGTLLQVAEPELPPYVRHFYVKTPVPRDFTGASTSVDSVLGFVVEGATTDQVELRIAECVVLADDIMKWA
ncbi:MAG: Argininosuccinate lyase [Streptosporangiaceae bacterium]|jgi:hypothetical protein|nr:Argininosuccinate lyase [Streptosporangiaceae bacterium]